MRRTERYGTRTFGFTLMELLISLSVIGVLVLIIAGTLSLSISSVEKGEAKFDELERVRASASVITSQIESWLPLTYKDKGGKRRFDFAAGRDSLTFPTNHSIWDGRQGYLTVTYRVGGNEAGRLSLYASERLIGKEQARQTVLLQGLDEIYFQYLLRDREAGTLEWVQTWEDYEAMPEMVFLTAIDGDRVQRFIVPVRTVRELSRRKLTPRGLRRNR